MNINLEKFKERLKNIEENSYKKKTEPRGLGIGMKISLDLISPIIVGILIGLGFDEIFSTKPVFFLIFLLKALSICLSEFPLDTLMQFQLNDLIFFFKLFAFFLLAFYKRIPRRPSGRGKAG